MDRRRFLRGLGSGLLLAPLTANAQQPKKIARVAILWNTPPLPPEIRRGLRDSGYVEGEDLVIEARWVEGKLERLPDLVSELLRLRPDVIFANGSFSFVHALKERAGTVPVVFIGAWDPVGTGLVGSLSRPGGSMTGTSTQSAELDAKRMELLKELVPGISRVAVLWYPGTPGEPLFRAMLKQTEEAGRMLGVQVRSVAAPMPVNLERAFVLSAHEGARAVIVLEGPVFFQERKRLAELAVQHRLLTMFTFRQYVDDGGLVAYGASISDLLRRNVAQVAKILQGARPGDLPVEQPTKFELVINLKTAKALGLTISPSVLARADEIIE